MQDRSHRSTGEKTHVKMNSLGVSMYPVLRPGDLLDILPHGKDSINVGDVIVFRVAGRRNLVVHRVVAVDLKGFRTRGDNNRKIDPWIVQPGAIVGRVGYVWRHGRRRKIHGGFIGLLRSWFQWAIKEANHKISIILHPLYRNFSRTGIFSTLWPISRATIQILSFDRPHGREFFLTIGRHIIGRCPPGTSQWNIRRPFRLFVKEAFLPSAGMANEKKQRTSADHFLNFLRK